MIIPKHEPGQMWHLQLGLTLEELNAVEQVIVDDALIFLKW